MRKSGEDALKCVCCGAAVDELCDVRVPLPGPMAEVPESERAERCRILDDEAAVLDDEHCFVRANLEIPIHGRETPWVVTGWGSLARQNFERLLDRWDDPRRTDLEGFFSWFCDALPGFEPHGALAADMIVRPVGQRPILELHCADHPLVIAQHEGIPAHVAVAHVRRIMGRE